MSDVADIMGLSKPQKSGSISDDLSSLGSPPPPKPKKPNYKKQFDDSNIKIKHVKAQPKKMDPNMRVGRWTFKPFFNPCRSDSLQLKHWHRVDDPDDYIFHRFDKKVSMLDYTEDQYHKYFESSEWTKQQTDELWDLLKRFDTRFLVVLDRLSFSKTLEQIKDRYYSISTQLLQISNPNSDLSEHPLIVFPYDRKSEERRKHEYEILYRRTKEQVDEENFLRQEYKRIEGALKKQQIVKKKKILKKKEEVDSEDSNGGFSSPKIKHQNPRYNILRSQMPEYRLSIPLKTNQRISEVLIGYGVHIPMGSPGVMKAVKSLRQDVLVSLDLEKHLQHQEIQLSQLKSRTGFSKRFSGELGSCSGRFMFAGYDNYSAFMWDVLKGEMVGKLEGHHNRISCLGVSPSGMALCTGIQDSTLVVWS